MTRREAGPRARMLARFFRAAAYWEVSRNGDVPEDASTLAHGLLRMADHIESLPEDDYKLAHMAETGYFDTGEFRPGPRAQELFRGVTELDIRGTKGLLLLCHLELAAEQDWTMARDLRRLEPEQQESEPDAHSSPKLE